LKILKLGGSVITKKDEPMTPNMENIQRLAREIKVCKAKKLVIIHGGGSYGHPLAKKHNLTNGYENKNQLQGFIKTHQAMLILNTIITKALNEAGILTIAIAPNSFLITSNNKIEKINTKVLSRYVEMEIVPVLYGDPVLDHKKGFTILSGDQLAVVLAKKLYAERIVFGVDVDGVFTSDPKMDKDSKLINLLNINDFEEKISVKGALPTDVTGGMLTKIREASEAVKSGIEVILVNANKEKRVEKALIGKEVRGTKLVFS
jgi:isopentenyl phosphate kinase